MTPPATIRFRGRAHTARTLALSVLLASQRHEGFAQELLDAALTESPLPPAERRLATQLTYGVMRRRGTLIALARPFLTRPLENVEPWLIDALCLGIFQLALSDRIPPHAAVHETVELASQFGRPGARGFLNAILRRVGELVTTEPAAGPAADALPVEGGRYRRLARAVLPSPEAAPVEYLSAGFSLPLWLATRWHDRYGTEECRRLGFWFAGPAPLTLRVNPLRTSRSSFLEACRQAGLSAEEGQHPQAVRLLEPTAIRDVPGYEQGWFCVQDETAMLAAPALNPEPGGYILDLCAAPGGKCTHLAELMGDRGEVIASDADSDRLAIVADLARRLGLVSVRVLSPDRLPTRPFDGVLVDVPCSNTGVLGRRPEARWRLRPEDLTYLVPLQERLLVQALERAKPGGVVVYSTCSIEPEENRGVVERVLRLTPGAVLEAEQVSIPGQPADGGYWARLRRG
jgi:16S rRNA (cytosine967-C5)-methyltransferase